MTLCVRFIEFNSTKKQQTLSFEPSNSPNSVENLTTFSYKENGVNELVADMVLLHEYLFNMMEHEFFNKLMGACTPHLKKEKKKKKSCNC